MTSQPQPIPQGIPRWLLVLLEERPCSEQGGRESGAMESWRRSKGKGGQVSKESVGARRRGGGNR